ncbi:MAG TPA: membrane dipeptidase [Burkholderiales bacterium]
MQPSRRQLLRALGAGLAAPLAAHLDSTDAKGREFPILMDGHVHVTGRAYWEGIDVWQPQQTGWDFARAHAAGVNVIIENLGTYGYWNYNYSPKETLRMIENFYRVAQQHRDKMALALTPADARRIAASGRVAVFLSVESGWDHEGDLDVLRAFYRLGLRSLQFSTQTGYNAMADVLNAGDANHWGAEHGLSSQGRAVAAEMNRLGMLIDITHGAPEAQTSLIEVSRAPVVASHLFASAVAGPGGLSDEQIKALAAKGGLVGIHGGSAAIGKRYRAWLKANPERAKATSAALRGLTGFRVSGTHNVDTDNYGEFIRRFDSEMRAAWRNSFAPWSDDPEAKPLVPTADEYAEEIDYIIKLVGPDHVGIGLDMVGGRSGVPADPSGYPQLIAAIKRVTTPANVRKVCGENWLRVLADVQRMRERDAG